MLSSCSKISVGSYKITSEREKKNLKKVLYMHTKAQHVTDAW